MSLLHQRDDEFDPVGLAVSPGQYSSRKSQEFEVISGQSHAQTAFSEQLAVSFALTDESFQCTVLKTRLLEWEAKQRDADWSQRLLFDVDLRASTKEHELAVGLALGVPYTDTLPIMKFLAMTLAAAAFVAGTPAATETLIINTPANAIQCENTLLSWTGGAVLSSSQFGVDGT
ncbi:hypothetical protein EIP91_004211 [Steccherinum ochraceum]|uniref:Uncharacterized protein n=1 Tax=Steccherinum ochraceum TaxID=92696 RepID=A0A4R0RA82_9APHY|nr:hypothetical protein EIP91_004211 [Steccherinum ochraceum]